MQEVQFLKEKINANHQEIVEALGMVIKDIEGNSIKSLTHKELIDKLEQSINVLRRC